MPITSSSVRTFNNYKQQDNINKAVYISFIHSHPDDSELPYKELSDHREQFGVQCLAQGHLDEWTRRAGDQTTDPDSRYLNIIF